MYGLDFNELPLRIEWHKDKPDPSVGYNGYMTVQVCVLGKEFDLESIEPKELRQALADHLNKLKREYRDV